MHDIFPEREEGLKVTTFGEEERQTPGSSLKNWVTVLISRSPFHLYKVLVSLYVKYGSLWIEWVPCSIATNVRVAMILLINNRVLRVYYI